MGLARHAAPACCLQFGRQQRRQWWWRRLLSCPEIRPKTDNFEAWPPRVDARTVTSEPAVRLVFPPPDLSAGSFVPPICSINALCVIEPQAECPARTIPPALPLSDPLPDDAIARGAGRPESDARVREERGEVSCSGGERMRRSTYDRRDELSCRRETVAAGAAPSSSADEDVSPSSPIRDVRASLASDLVPALAAQSKPDQHGRRPALDHLRSAACA
jgi:hypothetical protein